MKHHKKRTFKKRKGCKTYRRKRVSRKQSLKKRTYKSKYLMRGGWGLNAAPVVDTFKKYTGVDDSTIEYKENDDVTNYNQYMGGWGQVVQPI